MLSPDTEWFSALNFKMNEKKEDANMQQKIKVENAFTEHHNHRT